MISPTNSLSLLLHVDGTKGLANDQRFLLRISVTREPAYFLANDGSAIFDGRAKGSLAPPPMAMVPKRKPARTGAPSGPAGPNMVPTRGSTGQTLFGPKQNNQILVTPAQRPHSNRPHHGPVVPDIISDAASESEKYKVVTYQEDILLEEVCTGFPVNTGMPGLGSNRTSYGPAVLTSVLLIYLLIRVLLRMVTIEFKILQFYLLQLESFSLQFWDSSHSSFRED